MKKFLTLVVLASCAVAVGVSAAGASPQHATAKTVTVAMRDPGCHWFLAAGKYTKTLSVAGPVKLHNIDEATLVVKGPFATKLDRVGQSLPLGRGTYHITMVKQAPDDNHLTLVVR